MLVYKPSNPGSSIVQDKVFNLEKYFMMYSRVLIILKFRVFHLLPCGIVEFYEKKNPRIF